MARKLAKLAVRHVKIQTAFAVAKCNVNLWCPVCPAPLVVIHYNFENFLFVYK